MVVNVGNDHPIPIQALAEQVKALTRSKSLIERVPYEQAYAPGFEDMRQRRPALDRLQALTGFRPSRDLDTIIREVAEDVRSRWAGADVA